MALITSFWLVDSLLVISAFIYLLYKYVYRHFDYFEKRKIFYIEPSPFFGNIYEVSTFQTPAGDYFGKLYRNIREPFFGIFIFDKPHYVIRSPDLIKAMLVKDFNYFCDRTFLESKHDPTSANVLFVLRNPEWKMVRSKLTPVFTSNKLKAMVGHINKIGEDMKEYLRKHAMGNILDAKELTAKFSTDVIAKCAFGVNAHSFDRENPEFRNIGRKMWDFSLIKAIQQSTFMYFHGAANLFRFKFVPPECSEFLTRTFNRILEEREKENKIGHDLIDCIVELKKNNKFVEEVNFKGDKVVAQAIQFFMAGFETMSSISAFTLYELCIQPRVQTKLREEISKALNQNADLSYDVVFSMRYLHMCVCETLRKYPSLPFLDRKCIADYKIPGSNVIIEKGMSIFIPLFGLHYDETIFPNPQKYIPERFSENDVYGGYYLPFGDGPRNCIGARLGLLGTKLALIHILSEYEVSKCPETNVPLEFEPKSFLLYPKGGLPMTFKRSLFKGEQN